MVLAESVNGVERGDCGIKHQLELCVISLKNKCDKYNCTCHNSYDASTNGNSIQPCADYTSFEEALWNGWDTGEEIIGYRRINLPIIP